MFSLKKDLNTAEALLVFPGIKSGPSRWGTQEDLTFLIKKKRKNLVTKHKRKVVLRRTEKHSRTWGKCKFSIPEEEKGK